MKVVESVIEYICKKCDVSKMQFEIIPKVMCPKCGKYLEVLEEES